MVKKYKQFISEEIVGQETYDKVVKKALKDLVSLLKKDGIKHTIRDGYNMAWVDFLSHEVLIDGENNRNKYKIYKNKKSDMFYGKPSHVVNYIQTGSPIPAE